MFIINLNNSVGLRAFPGDIIIVLARPLVDGVILKNAGKE